MRIHWHFSAENVLFAGISAIVVINFIRLGSAKLAGSDNETFATAGRVIGSTVQF